LVLLSHFLKHPHDEQDWDSLRSRLAHYCTLSVVLAWLIQQPLFALANPLPVPMNLGDFVQAAGLGGLGAILAGLLLYRSRLRHAQKQFRGTGEK